MSTVTNQFCYCGQLKTIEIAEGNQNIIVANGVIFAKKMTHLISEGASNKSSYELPSILKTIGEYALTFCGFESITILDSVETIGNCAFAACNFSSIKIQKSVTSLEDAKDQM